MKKWHKKNYTFLLTTVVLLLGLLEMISYGGLYALAEYRGVNYLPILSKEMSENHKSIIARIVKNEFKYVQVDDLTGWSIAPGKSYREYQSNSQGLRANENYNLTPPSDRIRIGTFGDSFTHGDQVKNHETWQYYMEEANPEFQVLNFGVPGFGVDQAFLRYQFFGEKFNPDVVLIGFMTENVKRHVNVYRPFYSSGTSLPLAKPRFKMVDGKLTLIPSPLQTPKDYKALLETPTTMFKVLGAQDYHYHEGYHEGPFDFLASVRLAKMIGTKIFQLNGMSNLWGVYNANSEAFIVTLKILEAFYQEVLEDGKIPIIIILPHEEDVIRLKTNQVVRYQPLLDQLRAQNLMYIDGLNAFKHGTILRNHQKYFVGHYSPDGNLLIAQFLTKEIKSILKKSSVLKLFPIKNANNPKTEAS